MPPKARKATSPSPAACRQRKETTTGATPTSATTATTPKATTSPAKPRPTPSPKVSSTSSTFGGVVSSPAPTPHAMSRGGEFKTANMKLVNAYCCTNCYYYDWGSMALCCSTSNKGKVCCYEGSTSCKICAPITTCCKTKAQYCCCATMGAVPPDAEAPCQGASFGYTWYSANGCCKDGCCKKQDQFGYAFPEGTDSSIDVSKMTLCFALGFTNIYCNDSDVCKISNKGSFLCFENQTSSKCCVQVNTCYKTEGHTCCIVQRCACPCDADVPCQIANCCCTVYPKCGCCKTQAELDGTPAATTTPLLKSEE